MMASDFGKVNILIKQHKDEKISNETKSKNGCHKLKFKHFNK